MAPRGKKTDAETETAEAAAQPAETSTPAGDLSDAPADTGDAAAVAQPDPAAAEAETVAGHAVSGEAAKSGEPERQPADPSETDPAADLAAEASSAASDVLGTIIAQAETGPAPTIIGMDLAAAERRDFVVLDPVSLDGRDYAIGDDIIVTWAIHADLHKAGVIGQAWEDG